MKTIFSMAILALTVASCGNPVSELSWTKSDAPIYFDPSTPELGLTSTTKQWHAITNLDKFRLKYRTILGQQYAVAILDTGVKRTHVSIAGRMLPGYDFGNNDTDPTDVKGHGTAVAAVTASGHPDYQGVAPRARILPLKVFTDSGSGTMSRVEKALRYVIDNHAKLNVVAVNLSISDGMNHPGPVNTYGLEDEFKKLAELNVITVAAAGNYFQQYNKVPGLGYPAASPYTIAAGNHTMAGAAAASSQRLAMPLFIFAPGSGLTSATIATNTSIANWSGTSFASPVIAGVVVLGQQLAQRVLKRRLTFVEINGLLQSSGVAMADGYKRLDMLAFAAGIEKMKP